MRILLIDPDFEHWRKAAREALAQGFLPEEIDFQDATVARSLELHLGVDSLPAGLKVEKPYVPKAFLDLGQIAAVHREPDRWNLLYRLLYRLQHEEGLMHVEVDNDVAALHRLQHQVQRDLHKMHAFVRFRKVEEPDGEHFIAWYRPAS